MGSPEHVAVRKHCPAAVLEQDGASGDILRGHRHPQVFLQSVRAACQGTQQLWQFWGLSFSGQMAELCGRCWSTAKSGVGKAHRFILVWTKWEVGHPCEAEQSGCLQSRSRVKHDRMVGEGREASACAQESGSVHRHTLCAELCQWGWTAGRVFICSNGTLSVNATRLLEGAKPKGNAGARSRRWLLSPDELMGDWQVPKG